ncbi:NADH dehydrogenase [ubiquinone] 1 beta subcomplex subunit 4 isoform X2 [Gracilinanus agilis]|uniref:NADH dehydrogenase [ubiquinone] 1 beta subcomplex subunit 4 isoform X2 n=1 Tax=Gracilinanus agilis TaxID=191870 RepID=UPI001CFE4F58|nr:NADH dehydrogenase [ubiquinone] 1 beta subcomplex subunit 4 isoform X2 [Gracilinanus agilis]
MCPMELYGNMADYASIRAVFSRSLMLSSSSTFPGKPFQWTTTEDPALLRWTYARTANVYPNFRPTPKTSLLGAVFGIGPLVFWYYVFKNDRDRKEKLIQEGKLERPLSITS